MSISSNDLLMKPSVKNWTLTVNMHEQNYKYHKKQSWSICLLRSFIVNVASAVPPRILFTSYLFLQHNHRTKLDRSFNRKTNNRIAGVISAGVSVPVQIPSQTPDLTGNYWPRLQWSQLFGFPPASLLVGQESPPPPTATPGAVSRPLLASLGIPTQPAQHQPSNTPATTPVHTSDTSEWTNRSISSDALLQRWSRARYSITRDGSLPYGESPTSITAFIAIASWWRAMTFERDNRRRLFSVAPNTRGLWLCKFSGSAVFLDGSFSFLFLN